MKGTRDSTGQFVVVIKSSDWWASYISKVTIKIHEVIIDDKDYSLELTSFQIEESSDVEALAVEGDLLAIS